MGSCVGTCLTGWLETEEERVLWLVGGKLHLVGYLWEATRALCVFVCLPVCVSVALCKQRLSSPTPPPPTNSCQRHGGLM